MQNHTDSGILRLSKVHKYTKYDIKVSSDFWFPLLNVFLQLYVLTSMIKVIKYCDQNMVVLLNIIAITVCKMQK